jgi:hypothetical protein
VHFGEANIVALGGRRAIKKSVIILSPRDVERWVRQPGSILKAYEQWSKGTRGDERK